MAKVVLAQAERVGAKNILINCAAGVKRSGIMLAHLLVESDLLPAEDASAVAHRHTRASPKAEDSFKYAIIPGHSDEKYAKGAKRVRKKRDLTLPGEPKGAKKPGRKKKQATGEAKEAEKKE